MTRPMVFPGLMEALLSGSDTSQDGDKMRMRWKQDGAASIPAEMVAWACQDLGSASDFMDLTAPSLTMKLRKYLGVSGDLQIKKLKPQTQNKQQSRSTA